jgi:serine/threonine-protein kinase
MAPALTVDSFLDVIRRSRLIPEDKLNSVLQELDGEGVDVESPKALAEALIDRGLLTRWQSEYLLQGKHKGFFLGPYRFLKLLGKGGMGAVYLAEHEMMRRRCAIKVLPAKLIKSGSSVLERFYLEAQAVAALDDPNIVRAYDVNKEVQGKTEIHYLVMEYVEGQDLQMLVKEHGGGLDFVQVAEFARQAASGLAHAHESGLIHRDIKPANLLVDARGTVKILDLGLARFFDDKLEASLTAAYNESILGTADYLSPEQALNSHDVDTRTDIYSLGCTCYFMLTGQPPFPDGSVAQRLMAHQVKAPTSIEKFRPDVPADLVAIIDRMIAKKPEDRYQTAGEASDVFRTWLIEHADEAWKRKHRDMLAGDSSFIRRDEPTRAGSSPSEDTELELGLAPLDDDDGRAAPKPEAVPKPLDEQLVMPTAMEPDLKPIPPEELEAPSAEVTETPSSDSLAQPFDPLMTEPLENLDVQDPLSESGAHVAMGSGVNIAAGSGINIAGGSGVRSQSAVPLQAETSERTQLVMLLLIGFCISLPLAVVILIASLYLGKTGIEHEGVADAGSYSQELEEEGEDKPKPSDNTAKAEPDKGSSSPKTSPAESKPPASASKDSQRPKPKPGKPPGNSSSRPSNQAGTEGPAKMSSSGGQSDRDRTGKASPKASQSGASAVAPGGEDSQNSGAAVKAKPDQDASPPKVGSGEPEKQEPPPPADDLPPSAEEIRTFLSSLDFMHVTIDKASERAVDLMLLYYADKALKEARVPAVRGETDDAPAVLRLSVTSERARDGYLDLTVHGNLLCRFTDGDPVTVWEEKGSAGRVADIRMLKTRGPAEKVIRQHLDRFFERFEKDLRDLKTGG